VPSGPTIGVKLAQDGPVAAVPRLRPLSLRIVAVRITASLTDRTSRGKQRYQQLFPRFIRARVELGKEIRLTGRGRSLRPTTEESKLRYGPRRQSQISRVAAAANAARQKQFLNVQTAAAI